MGPGENAGAVDVGDGLAVAFKVESHNHPSAVEPFQGAATGVGGILRDIFAIGARPIAVLDSLRFGDLDTPRTRHLLERVVAGIGAYGNSVGVPTVGGEVDFEPPYEQNCLVNAMCVGLAPADAADPLRGRAGPGNVLVLLGARTGRDGIGGASVLASAELDEGDGQAPERADRRPVRGEQADRVLPRAGRRASCSSSLQDLGAAGLSSSTSEMAVEGRRRARPRRRAGAAARGGHGAVRDHDLRVAGADAVRGRARAAGRRCSPSASAGRRARRRSARSPTRGRLRVFDGERAGRRHAGRRARRRVPALRPRARRSRPTGWPSSRRRAAARAGRRRRPPRCARCSARANVASRRWVFEQYDSPGRQPHGAPARAGRRGRAAAGARRRRHRPRARRLDRRQRAAGRLRPLRRRGRGGLRVRRATSPASGAEPLGLTNCLNFGNPEKPHVAWQLTPRGRGHGGRLPRARRAGRRRQRVALQRGRRRGRSTRRRSSGWSASCPTPARAARAAFARRRRAD